MLPRINNEPKKEQQPQAKDEHVRNEAQEEEQKSVQPMGNEAMNALMLNQMLKAANAQTGEDFLAGLEEDEKLNESIRSSSNENNIILNSNNNVNNNINNRNDSEPEADDLDNSMYLNSSHNIVNDNWLEHIGVPIRYKDKNGEIHDGHGPDISNEPQKAEAQEAEKKPAAEEVKQVIEQVKNIVPQVPVQNNAQQANAGPQAGAVPVPNEGAIQEFYEDPEGPDWDSLDPNNPLNRDMVVEAPKKKGKKSKKKKKSGAQGNAGNDLNAANQDMQPAAGWNFTAQKLPARKKANWLQRFLTATAYYAGKTIGKAFNYLGNLFYIPLSGNLGKFWRSRTGNKENAKVTQEKRDHEIIPGWNGAKYEKGTGNDEVIADFRRVPTVWSRLTAAKAEDEHGKPLPPKVGVYVNQPKEGVDKDIDLINMGHSGIGIEYSRYSKATNRYERYFLRYGFYLAGATISGGILANSSNAIHPGTLADEYDSDYTVSRSFKATAKQVNDILNASETWADKGYNAATRNCTTFAKEMIRDVAHLPLGNDIFTEDHLRLSSLGNFGYFASSASTTNAKIGMESQFEKLGDQKDMSYAGFGNKRFTKDEYRRFKESRDNGGTKRITTADTPNSAAENLRRLEGPYAGTIGSMDFTGTLPKDESKRLDISFPNLRDAIDDACGDVDTAIQTVMGKDHQQLMAMYGQFPEMLDIYDRVSSKSLSLSLSDPQDFSNDPDILRNARGEIDQYIGELNKLLFQYFKNDKRLHLPVVHLISLLNRANQFIDEHYRLSERGAEAGGDLGNIRGNMFNIEYEIKSGEAKAMMSPSHYEAYIQIYKTPQEAVKKYQEYMQLKQIDDDPDQELSKEDKKKLAKAERIDKLADQFDLSHRYMLEKGSFSQQDVDYAFSLSEKERDNGEMYGALLDKGSAGGTYQSLILEKIFGGMKQRYLDHISAEEAHNTGLIRTWLEEDLNNCINRKKDDFIAVIRALVRASGSKDKDFLTYKFVSTMSDQWFLKVFKHGDANPALKDGANFIGDAFSLIMQDNQSPVKKTIDGIFKFVMAEDEQAKPDSLQAARKNAGNGKKK